MRYLFLSSLPGGAHNFFFKTLLLTDNTFINLSSMAGYVIDVDEKFNKLFDGYSADWKKDNNWIDIEEAVLGGLIGKGAEFEGIEKFNEYDESALLIFIQNHMIIKKDNLVGHTDIAYKMQISHENDSKLFNWIVMNCMYKSSFLGEKYLRDYKKHQQDDEVYKIKLKNFLNGPEAYISEFTKVCDELQIPEEARHYDYVRKAYNLWFETTLKLEDIPAYQKEIGWIAELN